LSLEKLNQEGQKEIGCRYIKDGNVEHLIMFLEFFDLFFVVVVLTIQKGEIR